MLITFFSGILDVLPSIGTLLLGVIGGGVAGFFIARAVMKKQLKDNPPITEKQIRAMLLQMGAKPSEAKIRAIMKSMKQNR